ncbi:class I SAM-dependent methyltransferase [uncultured Methylobacterium sp.]|jgi:SAM-dependent methyltransferase|uniref:class I SAM-dependent methyltransferase n=1 Tax=uncultured Methylobacterium sp. TaxID=157278 RepID=UPI0026074380|nr:class I SAM-dependent methyltransferase [uncultured Methylobacterium sp.]
MVSPALLIRSLVPFTPYPYVGESIACNLCGSGQSVLVAASDRRLKRLRSVACARCGLIRTDPMPTAAELAAYYAGAYRADYQFAFAGGPPRHHLRRAEREAGRRAALLAPVLVPGARVLDFGCGSGEFLAAARARGCEAVGVEPGRDYADHARRRHGVPVCDDLDHPHVAAGGFDLVAAHHVLEHLRDPADVVERLAGLLAPGGLLYAAVPDMAATGKPAHERFHFAHVHGFVRETLDLTARRAGLVPDAGYAREGTAAVYRRTDAPRGELSHPGLAGRLAEALRPVDPAVWLVSGAWLAPAVHRNARAIRDMVAPRPS